jgi:hypothetical protein
MSRFSTKELSSASNGVVRDDNQKPDHDVAPEAASVGGLFVDHPANHGFQPQAHRWLAMRKLIAFDDDTFDKLRQLARDRMGTFQELADEAFADLLRKHGIPVDLKDALRKSAAIDRAPAKRKARSGPARKTKS